MQTVLSYNSLIGHSLCFLLSFTDSGFTLGSLIHLKLIFVQHDRSGSGFILLYRHLLSITLCWRYCLFSLSFWHLCEMIGILGFGLPCCSISLCVSTALLYYYNSVIYLEIWNGSPSFRFRIASAIWGLLWFHMIEFSFCFHEEWCGESVNAFLGQCSFPNS